MADAELVADCEGLSVLLAEDDPLGVRVGTPEMLIMGQREGVAETVREGVAVKDKAALIVNEGEPVLDGETKPDTLVEGESLKVYVRALDTLIMEERDAEVDPDRLDLAETDKTLLAVNDGEAELDKEG